jgi:hypothetical protein
MESSLVFVADGARVFLCVYSILCSVDGCNFCGQLDHDHSNNGLLAVYPIRLPQLWRVRLKTSVPFITITTTCENMPTQICFVLGSRTVTYMFEDDAFVEVSSSHACVCPPSPLPITNDMLDSLMYFFTAEWILRVAVFAPAEPERTIFGRICQWFNYLTETSTLIDALGIFPYYLESLPNSFVSLRLVRLFRILQLVRLGQYNEMFLSLTNVLQKSVNYLKLLLLILTFGAAFFGSMMYWLEKGSWKYHEPSEGYRFLRVSVDGVTEEPTPFNSIPSSFWWFMVTATTVGYGGKKARSKGNV